MKPFTFLLLFALPFFSFAQDLADNSRLIGNPATHGSATTPAAQTVKKATSPTTTPASSWQQENSWQKEEDLVNGSISKSKLSKMRSVTASLINVLRDSCFIEGSYTPTWHGAYFSARNSGGTLMQFGVDCHFADQHAELTITANDLQPLLGHLAAGSQQFLTMDISPVVKNGGQYFEYTGMDGNVTVKRWLITTGIGRLPYVAVTRKEYLQAAKIELAATRAAIIAAVKEKATVRPADVQEAEKKATIDQLKAMYTGIALEFRMRQYLKNYRTDEQYLKDNTDNETAAVDGTMHLMDTLLAHLSPAELGKPAIVSVPAIDFNGFEDGHTDKMLVRINPTYFNGGLSDEKPQLFLVEWRYDGSNAAAADIDQQLTQNFDGQQLKALLGK
jgi:hypothetical protein